MGKEELLEFINLGLSQREIVRLTGKSQTTVRYWLGRHGLKTQHKKYNRVEYQGKYIERLCAKHGSTEFIFEQSKNGYRCKKCRSGKVSEDRRKLKRKLVEVAGGKCYRCGYDKSFWALQFHHRNASEKEREIGHLIRDRKLKPALKEIAKCDLVCANCHAELEEEKWNQ